MTTEKPLNWEKMSLQEQIDWDEKNCVPGSLAHDRKLTKEREDYLKSISMKGGCVSNKK